GLPSFWKLLEIDERERYEQAPRSPCIRHSGYDDCNTHLGANGAGCRVSRQRAERRFYDPQLFRDVESSRLSLVRAAGLRSWTGDEQGTLAPGVRFGASRHVGTASAQG